MYSGLIPADDAPDIVANTFLATLSDETLKNIRYSFLEHRERECYLTSFFFFWNSKLWTSSQSSQLSTATLHGQ
jgi:hypothetical protein